MLSILRVIIPRGSLAAFSSAAKQDQSDLLRCTIGPKNPFHASLNIHLRGESYLPRGERQQGNVARPLDGRCKAALVRSAHPGQPPWDDLASLRHKLAEQTYVLVINVVNLLHAELADLLATEKFASTIAAAGPTIGSRTIRPSAAVRPWRWC
jgi:hypothetical protein